MKCGRSLYGVLLFIGGIWTALFGFSDWKHYGSWVHYPPNPVGWLVALVGVGWVIWAEAWERRGQRPPN